MTRLPLHETIRRLLVLSLLLSLFACFGSPVVADDTSDTPPLGALYLGQSRMLEAAQPRQLSLNAHVQQFAYQPGGLEIAYLSTQKDGDAVTQVVKIVGLKRGETTTLLTQAIDDPELHIIGLSLVGWTADARYLIVRIDQYLPVPDSPAVAFRPAYTSIDVASTPLRLRAIPLPLPAPSSVVPIVRVKAWWSPGHGRLLFEQTAFEVAQPQESVRACSIYDPARDHLDTYPLAPREEGRGWLDETHLLIAFPTDNMQHFFSLDTSTGKRSEIPRPAKMPTYKADDSTDVSPKAPNLKLDVEERFHPDRQGVTGIDSHLLWVRRTGGLKKLSAMPVGLTPGPDDPQAVWSPTGQQIAYVEHGDLFVTDLSVREADPREKYLAGEKLTCPEEQWVAAESLKQIGLGILQYTQDNDEKWPVGDVRSLTMPYLKDSSLFSVGNHPFVYHAPPGPSIADMDSPATFVLGTIDLPCALVTLYADGHVRAILKAGGAGAVESPG